ncbi:MAG: hypothetical protein ACREBS_07330, partial [Nitrososphaerales archaeon]
LTSMNETDSAIKSLILGDQNLTFGYEQLQPLISEKLTELSQKIELAKSQGFTAAQAVVYSNIGKCTWTKFALS